MMIWMTRGQKVAEVMWWRIGEMRQTGYEEFGSVPRGCNPL